MRTYAYNLVLSHSGSATLQITYESSLVCSVHALKLLLDQLKLYIAPCKEYWQEVK